MSDEIKFTWHANVLSHPYFPFYFFLANAIVQFLFSGTPLGVILFLCSIVAVLRLHGSAQESINATHASQAHADQVESEEEKQYRKAHEDVVNEIKVVQSYVERGDGTLIVDRKGNIVTAVDHLKNLDADEDTILDARRRFQDSKLKRGNYVINSHTTLTTISAALIQIIIASAAILIAVSSSYVVPVSEQFRHQLGLILGSLL